MGNVQQVVEHVKAEDVKTELRAQIIRALNFGVPLSHLDTHMGAVVSRPDLFEVYVRLGLEFNLPVLFVRQLDEHVPPNVSERGPQMLALLQERGFPTLDRLEQYYDGGSHEQRRERYLNFLNTVQPGVTQMIIHCGYDDGELRAITSSSQLRDSDRRTFMDPLVEKRMRDLGIELLTWRRFHQLEEERVSK